MISSTDAEVRRSARQSRPERGYAIDLRGGTTEVKGKRIYRLLVTQPPDRGPSNWSLDGDNVFYHPPASARRGAGGRARKSDWKRVTGISVRWPGWIVPFRIGVYVGDRLLNETVDRSRSRRNPPLAAAVFKPVHEGGREDGAGQVITVSGLS